MPPNAVTLIFTSRMFLITLPALPRMRRKDRPPYRKTAVCSGWLCCFRSRHRREKAAVVLYGRKTAVFSVIPVDGRGLHEAPATAQSPLTAGRVRPAKGFADVGAGDIRLAFAASGKKAVCFRADRYRLAAAALRCNLYGNILTGYEAGGFSKEVPEMQVALRRLSNYNGITRRDRRLYYHF
jgi:hypothetical protein